jgi:hypothetical protein
VKAKSLVQAVLEQREESTFAERMRLTSNALPPVNTEEVALDASSVRARKSHRPPKSSLPRATTAERERARRELEARGYGWALT